MTFVDSSFYLSLLIPTDSNHQRAVEIFEENRAETLITSYQVIGEVLTVGSQRYDRQQTIEFVQKILLPRSDVLYETEYVIAKTWHIFTQVRQKNIGWVDCSIRAIMLDKKINDILTFDRDFIRLKKYS